MSVTKSFTAIAINGIAGFEIIVKGDANVGKLQVMPELEKAVPQGTNPAYLLLNLLNASDATPETFQKVQYNEKIVSQDTYQTVDIFFKGQKVETLPVKKGN